MIFSSMVDEIYEKDLYLYFMERIYTEEWTQIEINFLINLLSIKHHHKILDLPCGHGRHSIAFSKKGYQVVGVDVSSSFITEAKKRAEEQNLLIDHRIEDMRKIEYNNEFDIVLCLGTSFGIFSKDENREVLKRISKALKPGGKFCLEHYSPHYPEMVKKGIKRTSIFELEGNFLLDRISFHENTHQIEYKRTYLLNEQRKDASLFFQIYSMEQLDLIFQSLGLKITDIYGNPRGHQYTKDSHLMMLVANKL